MTKKQHSQQNLSIPRKRILLLGTGGTIAGLSNAQKSRDGADASLAGYTAARLTVDALLPMWPSHITTEQISQIDSKDMSFSVWERLYERLCVAMEDTSIGAVVITHGTDTLEETAYFLYRTLVATKPVVLTGAMRPADAVDSDGPNNLTDALRVASDMSLQPLGGGVWVVFAGQTLRGDCTQKVHPHRLDAFVARDDIKREGDAWLMRRLFALKPPYKCWPWVEIVMNYAGASGQIVEALMVQNVDGIVVAGTGNGTISKDLVSALRQAASAGIAICLTTRCPQGQVVQDQTHMFEVSPLPAPQARVELLLELLSKTS